MPSWVFMKPVGFSQRGTQQKVLQAHLWVPLVEPAIFYLWNRMRVKVWGVENLMGSWKPVVPCTLVLAATQPSHRRGGGGGYKTMLKRQCFKYFNSSYETAVQMTMHVFPTLCFVVSGGRILCIENWKLKTLSSSFFFGPSAVPVSLHQFHKPHKQQISLGEINLKFRPKRNWDLVLLYHTKLYFWLFNRRGFEWNAINFEMIVGGNSNSLNYANASI